MTSASSSGTTQPALLDVKARILWALATALMVVGIVGMVKCTLPWDAELQQSIAERSAADKAPTLEQYIDLTLWWAAAAVTLIGITLTATARLWAPKWIPPSKPESTVGSLRQRSTAATWIALIAITVTAGIIRAPRMDHSFWNDEEVTIQDYSWGKYSKQKEVGAATELKFKPVDWEDAAFYNRGGSNHVLNSLLTKLTIDADNTIRGNDGEHFSERTARLIPFAASLATVLLIGWIGWRGFNQITGLVAAATLALNPWHVRYSTEIRGYSVLLLLILVALVCLYLALNTGRRRYWIGFALAETGFMLSFFASVYVAVALNLAALVWIGCAGRTKAQLLQPFFRLTAANLAAAALFIPIAAPSIPQFLSYLDAPLFDGFANGWLNDFYHHLVLGIPPWLRSPELNAGITAPQLFAESPWIESLLQLIVPTVLILGALSALLARDRRHVFLVATLTLAPVLSYLHNWLSDSPALPWYLLYAVLPFALLCGYACSIALAMAKHSKSVVPAVASTIFAVAWLTTYALATQSPRHHLAEVPRQPLREVAQYLRGNAPSYGAPDLNDRVTASLGFSVKRLRSYDPHIHTLRSTKELEALTEETTSADLPLYVAVCGETLIARDPKKGACLEFLHDPANGFIKQAHVMGFETQFSYDIYVREPQ